MIGHLRGTLLERSGHTVVIDCAGVGYEVHLSVHSLGELGPEGSEVALRVYTHFIKSDFSITLYGFTSARERALFDLLITVKNVGPASAMKILSTGASPVDIARLIAAGQVSALTALRGVGKKTAELLVVELRERCEQLLASWGHLGAPAVAGRPAGGAARATQVRPPLLEDVALALGQLGWRPTEVDKAVDALVPEPDATFEGLLRQALRSMPR
ncbi:MAG TPA: Holliday junction branch migration protein RuvA [Kofleriaceae bacterium]|nr:Holliday junction branch migration protein RuvA [Kofleriaceae bacterium]